MDELNQADAARVIIGAHRRRGATTLATMRSGMIPRPLVAEMPEPSRTERPDMPRAPLGSEPHASVD